MAWCSDPLLNTLKSFGYSVVRLPKTDIRPLQILVRKGNDLDRLGDVVTLFVQGTQAEVPTITVDRVAANVSGQRSGEVNYGLGISVLGNWIAAMGGSKLGLDAQYKGAKSVVFEFSDVLEDSIEVLKLDQYLAGADVNPLSRHAAELLESDELYATTATIKSRKFAVEAKQSKETTLKLDVPVIQEVVGGNVKVSASGVASSKITYEGSVPLVFGFQAVRLFYDRGRYTAFAPLEPGAGLRALERSPADGATRLMVESPLVRLHSD